MMAPLTPDEANRAVRRLLELDDQLGVVGLGVILASMAFSALGLVWMLSLDRRAEALLDQFTDAGDSRAFVRASLVRRGARVLLLSPFMLGLAAMQASQGIEHSFGFASFNFVLAAICVAGSLFAAWFGATLVARSFSSDDGALFSGAGKKCLEDFDKRRAATGSASMSAGAVAT